MIRLAVNADDAGIDPPRNRGILAAFREGIVTSASVIAGAPASEDFLAAAGDAVSLRGRPLGIGLHLNLTGGRPLVPCRTLTGPEGLFLPKGLLWEMALGGAIDGGEVAREVEAQWSWLAARHAAPDHIDGHNHVHVLPVVAEALARIAPPGIWVRAVLEAPPDPGALDAPVRGLFEDPRRLGGALAELSRRAEKAWGSRFRSAGGFRGLRLTDGYSAGRLVEVLAETLEGIEEAAGAEAGAVLELMVHPGELDAASVPFSARPARREELEALRAPGVREFLRGRGVVLSSFAEVP